MNRGATSSGGEHQVEGGELVRRRYPEGMHRSEHSLGRRRDASPRQRRPHEKSGRTPDAILLGDAINRRTGGSVAWTSSVAGLGHLARISIAAPPSQAPKGRAGKRTRVASLDNAHRRGGLMRAPRPRGGILVDVRSENFSRGVAAPDRWLTVPVLQTRRERGSDFRGTVSTLLSSQMQFRTTVPRSSSSKIL